MITRSNLAEQLREYQVRSTHEWAIVSFFTSSRDLLCEIISFSGCSLLDQVYILLHQKTARHLEVQNVLKLNIICTYFYPRVDVILVIWELLMFAFIVFSGVALYFRYMKVALALMFLTFVMLVSMKVTRQVRRNRKMKRKMLLPLSM